MNVYNILATFDYVDFLYDIYVDTIEAWTAEEALALFCEKTFDFKQMYFISGNHAYSVLQKCYFKAFPMLIDKENPQRFLCLPYRPRKENFITTERKKNT